MSDRIGVMRSGKLVQVGTPEEIYSAPKDKFVSEFMGDVNVIAVRMNGGNSCTRDELGQGFMRRQSPPVRHRPSRHPPRILRFVDQPRKPTMC